MNLEKSGQISLEKLFSERTVYKMKAIRLVMEQFKSLPYKLLFSTKFHVVQIRTRFFLSCVNILWFPQNKTCQQVNL